MRPVCPLCQKYISEWAVATGKTETINEAEVHKSCVAFQKEVKCQKTSFFTPETGKST